MALKPRRGKKPKAKKPLVKRARPTKLKAAAPPPAPANVPPPPRARPADNTSCDFYVSPNAPPATPDLAAVPCCLKEDFARGSEAGEGSQTFRWTHVLSCAASADLRDTWPSTPANTVHVPDKNGTPFLVVFVELVGRGTAGAYKRVFLNRQTPPWPTSEL